MQKGSKDSESNKKEKTKKYTIREILKHKKRRKNLKKSIDEIKITLYNIFEVNWLMRRCIRAIMGVLQKTSNN